MIEAPAIYVALGLVVLLLTVLLVGASGRRRSPETRGELYQGPPAWDSDSLQIGKRIFDPTDYVWLKDSLKAPLLAHEMATFRKTLALRWLSQTAHDFRELVHTFRENPGQMSPHRSVGEMNILWQALSFHGLMLFTKISVLLFGPFKTLGNFGWPARYLAFFRDHLIFTKPAGMLSRSRTH